MLTINHKLYVQLARTKTMCSTIKPKNFKYLQQPLPDAENHQPLSQATKLTDKEKKTIDGILDRLGIPQEFMTVGTSRNHGSTSISIRFPGSSSPFTLFLVNDRNASPAVMGTSVASAGLPTDPKGRYKEQIKEFEQKYKTLSIQQLLMAFIDIEKTKNSTIRNFEEKIILKHIHRLAKIDIKENCISIPKNK